MLTQPPPSAKKPKQRAGARCELHLYPGVGHLLTRNLKVQYKDFDQRSHRRSRRPSARRRLPHLPRLHAQVASKFILLDFDLLLLERFSATAARNKILQRRLIHLLTFVDIDRTPDIPVKAGVEQTGRILQRSSLGKRQLHDILVRLSRAHNAACDQTGVPLHFHSSTISGSVL